MPRPPRYDEIGIYHIINRGVERRDIFLQQKDYDQFMTLMGDLVTKYGIAIHAFCLMANHYHILLETVTDNLSDAIKHLNTNYSKFSTKQINAQVTYGKDDSNHMRSMMKHNFGKLLNTLNAIRLELVSSEKSKIILINHI